MIHLYRKSSLAGGKVWRSHACDEFPLPSCHKKNQGWLEPIPWRMPGMPWAHILHALSCVPAPLWTALINYKKQICVCLETGDAKQGSGEFLQLRLQTRGWSTICFRGYALMFRAGQLHWWTHLVCEIRASFQKCLWISVKVASGSCGGLGAGQSRAWNLILVSCLFLSSSSRIVFNSSKARQSIFLPFRQSGEVVFLICHKWNFFFISKLSHKTREFVELVD